MKEYLVCSVCGGKNVQIKAWIDPNVNETIDDSYFDDEDTWCDDCKNHTGLITESEFLENKSELKEN